MKIAIPDKLMNYEQAIIRELLIEQHALVFERIDPDTQIIMTGATPLEHGQLTSLAQLQGIVRFARGKNDLSEEIEFCQSAGIQHFQISGMSAQSTAEHTIMLMMALLRQLPLAMHYAQQGKWRQTALSEHGIRDLSEVTVGLIGLGRVGQKVADLLNVFGTRVLYTKLRRLDQYEEVQRNIIWADLETLLRTADIVSMHARSQQAPILSATHLRQLKPGAFIIQTGNGQHIEQDALFQYMLDGTLLAGLDVFAEEPWSEAQIMILMEGNRHLMTPHVAGRSQKTARVLFKKACALVERIATQKVFGEKATKRSGMGDGLTLKVVDALSSHMPFANTAIYLPQQSRSILLDIVNVLKSLGCKQVRWQQNPMLCIETPQRNVGKVYLDISLSNDASQTLPDTFYIRDVPTLRFLLERWQLDYTLWNELLPREARGSLPGQLLVVHGYGQRGKLISYRAQQVGMRVMIFDPDPLRMLEASFDGFEIYRDVFSDSALHVYTNGTGNESGLTPFKQFDTIPAGLHNEFTALVTVALYVLTEMRLRTFGNLHMVIASRICNQLFTNILASYHNDIVAKKDIWDPNNWDELAT